MSTSSRLLTIHQDGPGKTAIIFISRSMRVGTVDMPTGLCRLPHHCDHTCLTKDAHTPHMLTLICLEHPQSHIHKLTCTWRIAYMFTHKIHKHTCSLLSVYTCMRFTYPCLYIRTFPYVPFTHLHTHLNLHSYPYTLTILTCIHMCTCSLIHPCLHTHTHNGHLHSSMHICTLI